MSADYELALLHRRRVREALRGSTEHVTRAGCCVTVRKTCDGGYASTEQTIPAQEEP
jgi:hypothetical protein